MHLLSKRFGGAHSRADHLGTPGSTSGLFVFLGIPFGGLMSVAGFGFCKKFQEFLVAAGSASFFCLHNVIPEFWFINDSCSQYPPL
jgi:hypothetical protein